MYRHDEAEVLDLVARFEDFWSERDDAEPPNDLREV